MQADLDGHLKFPKEVAVTDKRLDMILISTESKKVSLVELTVPSEERVEVSGELKKTKYAQLQHEGKTNGWNVQVWTIEDSRRPQWHPSSKIWDLQEERETEL